MNNDLNHPTPDFDRERHPYGVGWGLGGGLGLGNPNDPTDPAWGDVFAGIWDRLANPLPR